MRSIAYPPLLSLLAVSLGFALMSLGFVERAFLGIAMAQAAAGREWLDALGYEVMRTGGELRDLVDGFAVEVTEVCDGHGVLIGWAGVLLALGRGWLALALGLGLGFAAILLFNLLRVVLLYMASSLGVEAFEAIHYFVFPLLTALLIIGFGAAMFPTVRRNAALAAGVTLALAFAWYFVADAVSAAATPAANALLWAFGPIEATTIAERTSGWTVGTRLVESVEPLRLRLAPIHPSDFLLAAPVLAGAAIAAKQGWGMVLAGCIAMIAAMALGATTSVWGVAVAGGATQIALPAGPGLLRAETYAPPPDIALGLVVLAQNVLVHFNLLVLPALILCRRASERHA